MESSSEDYQENIYRIYLGKLGYANEVTDAYIPNQDQYH